MSPGYEYHPAKFPVNYWGSSAGLIDFRVKLADVDYVVMAKLLELNSTQESHLGSVYRFAKDSGIEMRNLKDLGDVVSYLVKHPEKSVGSSGSSLGVIYRNIANLQSGGLEEFFGVPELESKDLFFDRINILWLQNYQKEKFNSGNLINFILYRLYNELPEVGDVPRPKMVIFIDEAHQLFRGANDSLVDLMVSLLKQIRSKGVGIIFNTQSAEDIPERILEQLGLKVQFALRAFSQKELQHIRGAVDSFPKTDFYDMKEEVKSLEIGTAFVSILDVDGVLLPPVRTVMYPPASLMDAPSEQAIGNASDVSLKEKYAVAAGSRPIVLGSSLDDISVSRGGKWQIQGFLLKKEDQVVRREANRRNRKLRGFMYLVIAILGLSAFIFFLFLVYRLTNRIS